MMTFKHTIITGGNGVQTADIKLTMTAVELVLINAGHFKQAANLIAQLSTADRLEIPCGRFL